MKIPKYQRQTTFPKQAGAQFLNVGANPNALSAPGAALADLGGRIQTEGLRWLEREIKTARAVEQAGAESTFHEWLAKARVNLQNFDVSDQMAVYGKDHTATAATAEFERKALQQIKTIGKTIKNSDVRSRAVANMRNKVFSAMPAVSANLRKTYADHATGEWTKLSLLEEAEMSHLEGELFEKNMTEHVNTIHYWADLGGWDAAKTQKEVQKSQSRIDELRFARNFAGLDSEGMALEIKKLREGHYKYITPDKLDRMILSSERSQQTKLAREQAKIIKDRNNAERDKQRNQKKMHFELDQRINQGRDQRLKEAQGEFIPEDKRIEVPTVAEIDAIDERDLSVAHKNKLKSLIKGQDIVQAPEAVNAIKNMIIDAVDRQDLEDIDKLVDKFYFDDRGIGHMGWTQLQRALDDKENNLPGVASEERYKRSIGSIIFKAGVMIHAPGSSKLFQEAPQIGREVAYNFYAGELLKGVRPGVAFLNTMERFLVETRHDEFLSTALSAMPSNIWQALGSPREGSDLAQINQDQLNAAWKAWLNDANDLSGQALVEATGFVREEGHVKLEEKYTIQELGKKQREGRITQKQRLGYREIYFQEKLLDMLTHHINKVKLSAAVRPEINAVRHIITSPESKSGDVVIKEKIPHPVFKPDPIYQGEGEAAVAERIERAVEDGLAGFLKGWDWVKEKFTGDDNEGAEKNSLQTERDKLKKLKNEAKNR